MLNFELCLIHWVLFFGGLLPPPNTHTHGLLAHRVVRIKTIRVNVQTKMANEEKKQMFLMFDSETGFKAVSHTWACPWRSKVTSALPIFFVGVCVCGGVNVADGCFFHKHTLNISVSANMSPRVSSSLPGAKQPSDSSPSCSLTGLRTDSLLTFSS